MSADDAPRIVQVGSGMFVFVQIIQMLGLLFVRTMMVDSEIPCDAILEGAMILDRICRPLVHYANEGLVGQLGGQFAATDAAQDEGAQLAEMALVQICESRDGIHSMRRVQNSGCQERKL